jgi:hypothetical protein
MRGTLYFSMVSVSATLPRGEICGTLRGCSGAACRSPGYRDGALWVGRADGTQRWRTSSDRKPRRSRLARESTRSRGVDHIVEVAFGANVDADVELLKNDGSVATYATDNATSKIPFWQMVFMNIRVYFLGNDDFPCFVKTRAHELAESSYSSRSSRCHLLFEMLAEAMNF